MKRLAAGWTYDHIVEIMDRRTPNRALLLLLGALFVLGTTIAAVQASAMAVKTTLSFDTGTSGSDSCRGCDGNDGSSKKGSCHAICIVAGMAMLPRAPVVVVTESDPIGLPPRTSASGLIVAPDPSPPRAGFFG